MKNLIGHALLVCAFFAGGEALADDEVSADSPSQQTSGRVFKTPAEQIAEHTWKLRSATPAAAEIADLQWLQGYWVGNGLGGECEENWGAPFGDRMHGYFSLRKEGSPVFSEALMLVEENESVVMRVKHFSPKFEGWEEKEEYLTFGLVKIEQNAAYFNGLTFIRNAAGNLAIYLVLSENGETSEHTFNMTPYQSPP